jgi:hypothetical protein
MSQLYYIETSDFSIQPSQRGDGNILCHSISGISVVLFYNNRCENSKKYLQIFKKIPVNNVHFGLVNLDSQVGVVKMSYQTKYPIKYVPLIFIYYNGMPYASYNTNTPVVNQEDLCKFIVHTGNYITKQVKEKLEEEKRKRGAGGVSKHKSNILLDYSYGVPLYGDDLENVTYLTFNELGELGNKNR